MLVVTPLSHRAAGGRRQSPDQGAPPDGVDGPDMGPGNGGQGARRVWQGAELVGGPGELAPDEVSQREGSGFRNIIRSGSDQ